jgi:hypothetical protein
MRLRTLSGLAIMAGTLSDISSQLFRDVQSNHAAAVQRLEALEEARREALKALAGAAALLRKWDDAVADAASSRDQALARIEQDLVDAERDAGERRSAALAQVAQRFRQAEQKAAAARDRADEDARKDYEDDLAAIAGDDVEAGQKVLARSDAYRRLKQRLDAARAAYLETLEANWNTQQDEMRTVNAREAAEYAGARDHARTQRDRAQQLHERALKAAETRLRSALAQVPGADDVQADFDRRRETIKRESREREAALYEAYREARRQLERSP